MICVNPAFFCGSRFILQLNAVRTSHGAHVMIDEESGGSDLPPGVIFQNSDQCLPAAELTDYRLMAVQLRKELARSEALLLQKDELIHRQELLKADDLQMTISLLSLQSRNSTNPEAASQLTAAASRVSMIARIHRRLHSCEGVRTIEFKKFLEDFGREFSVMSSSDGSTGKISVDGIEINLPAPTAVPLGFIANELITNAAKYGKGRTDVRLESDQIPETWLRAIGFQ